MNAFTATNGVSETRQVIATGRRLAAAASGSVMRSCGGVVFSLVHAWGESVTDSSTVRQVKLVHPDFCATLQ